MVFTLLETGLWLLGTSYQVLAWGLVCLVRRRFVGATTQVQVGVRNSVYFRYPLFLISDIDLTVLSDSAVANKEVFGLFMKVKKVIKVVGEVNVYHCSTLELLSRQMNCCELARDPLLSQHVTVKVSDDIGCQAQAIVFYLRMLDADAKNLAKWPWLRKRKWRHHLELVKKQWPQFPLDDWRDVGKKGLFGDLCLKRDDFYRPHRWMNKHYDQVSLEAASRSIVEQDELTKAIFVEQLAWELCGVYGQYLAIDNDKQVKQHLMNLRSLLRGMCASGHLGARGLDRDLALVLASFDSE